MTTKKGSILPEYREWSTHSAGAVNDRHMSRFTGGPSVSNKTLNVERFKVRITKLKEPLFDVQQRLLRLLADQQKPQSWNGHSIDTIMRNLHRFGLSKDDDEVKRALRGEYPPELSPIRQVILERERLLYRSTEIEHEVALLREEHRQLKKEIEQKSRQIDDLVLARNGEYT